MSGDLDPDLDTAALAARFRRALMPLVRQLRTQVEEGMTPSLMSALATVSRQGPITLGDLAHAEKVTPPMATKLGSRLAEQGLVDRAGCDDDRRVVRLSLTDEGRAVLDRASKRRDAWLAIKFADLEPHEQGVLAEAIGVLERLSR